MCGIVGYTGSHEASPILLAGLRRLEYRGYDSAGVAILDGDPFQPLWYGWAYRFAEFQSLSTMVSFYREAVAAGHLAFPDCYILLAIAEPELRARKQGMRHDRDDTLPST